MYHMKLHRASHIRGTARLSDADVVVLWMPVAGGRARGVTIPMRLCRAARRGARRAAATRDEDGSAQPDRQRAGQENHYII